jgi:ferric-dicitrate binding protein FerR (iron transport regulator)
MTVSSAIGWTKSVEIRISDTIKYFVGVVVAFALAHTLGAGGAAAEEARTVGQVERALGTVLIGQDKAHQTAQSGTPVHRGDRIETTRGARLALVLDDGTRLLLGPSTTLTLREVVGERGKNSPFAVASMLGAMQAGALVIELDSGKVRLTPATRTFSFAMRDRRVEVRTKSGTVRWTDADVVLERQAEQLSLVVLDGRAQVRNSAGMTEVDRARHGVDMVRVGQAPGRTFGWDRERIARLLAEIGD